VLKIGNDQLMHELFGGYCRCTMVILNYLMIEILVFVTCHNRPVWSMSILFI
jgi:hypothetical protein